MPLAVSTWSLLGAQQIGLLPRTPCARSGDRFAFAGTWCARVQPCACPRTRTCLAARAPLLPAAQLPRRAMAATAVPAPPPGHLLTDAHASAVARAQHGAQPMCTPRAPARPARRAHSAPRLRRPPAGTAHNKPTLNDDLYEEKIKRGQHSTSPSHPPHCPGATTTTKGSISTFENQFSTRILELHTIFFLTTFS